MQSDSIAGSVQEIQHGSNAAAERIYAQYHELVLKVVRRHLKPGMRRLADSVDFAQVVWKTIFEHVSDLDKINDPERFAAHIARIAINKVMDEARSQFSLKRDVRRLSPQHDCDCSNLVSRDPSPSQSAIAQERLDSMCSELTAVQKEMVQQKLAGYHLDEIADNLHVNERTVRRVLKRLSES